MIDISTVQNGKDLGMSDTQAPKAGNILSVQVGNLEYAPTLGIDLDYFLQPNLKFQNTSFNSYLVQVLANWGVNVAEVSEIVHSLYKDLNIKVKADDNTTALVGR